MPSRSQSDRKPNNSRFRAQWKRMFKPLDAFVMDGLPPLKNQKMADLRGMGMAGRKEPTRNDGRKFYLTKYGQYVHFSFTGTPEPWEKLPPRMKDYFQELIESRAKAEMNRKRAVKRAGVVKPTPEMVTTVLVNTYGLAYQLFKTIESEMRKTTSIPKRRALEKKKQRLENLFSILEGINKRVHRMDR